MIKNIGEQDKKIRIAAGVILLLLGIFAGGPGWLSWILAILGVIALATGLLSYCPCYQVCGLNTAEAPPPAETEGKE